MLKDKNTILNEGEYFIEEIENNYGIFHTDMKSGFCYALFSDEKEAENYIIDKNKKVVYHG